MMAMTGACVAAIPNALGMLLAMVPFRLILILPPVLAFASLRWAAVRTAVLPA